MYLFNEDFWLAISFLIFVYLAYHPIKDTVLKSLDQKILVIKQRVSESKKMTEDRELLFANAVNQIQKIDVLREEMLQKGQEATEVIIEAQNKEIVKFLENKKQNNNDLININNSKSAELLHTEFCNKIIKLAILYLRTTQNEGKLDMEIARQFIEGETSTNSNHH